LTPSRSSGRMSAASLEALASGLGAGAGTAKAWAGVAPAAARPAAAASPPTSPSKNVRLSILILRFASRGTLARAPARRHRKLSRRSSLTILVNLPAGSETSLLVNGLRTFGVEFRVHLFARRCGHRLRPLPQPP